MGLSAPLLSGIAALSGLDLSDVLVDKKLKVVYNAVRNNNLAKWLKNWTGPAAITFT